MKSENSKKSKREPRIYCRSCNREIVVREELSYSYIEDLSNGGTSYHPKEDCDVRYD